jgi:hypothetical protein
VSSGDKADASGQIYLQSGLGISSKVEFPSLSNFKDSLGNIVINRADLVIELNPASVDPTTYYEPIGVIDLLKLNSSGETFKYLDANGNYSYVKVQADMYPIDGYTYPLVSYYDGTTHTYSMNISTYIHAILYGTEENNGLIIASNPIVSSVSVNRVYAEKSKVKLKVYYTKVD